jgi:hypothetical protein
MKRLLSLALLGAACALAGCTSEKIEVLKSPCVGLEGSPCGPKRPVNGTLNPQLQREAPVETV